MKVITDIYIFKTSDDIRIYKALWDTGCFLFLTEIIVTPEYVDYKNISFIK